MLEPKNRRVRQLPNRASRRVRFLALGVVAFWALALTGVLWAQLGQQATDPGVRGINWCTTGCTNGAGTFQSTLTPQEQASEAPAQAQFTTAAIVTDPNGVMDTGLGPRFNSNSCSSCHQQPALGGSSPSSNPLFQVYQSDGTDHFNNAMPSFETQSGPILVPHLPPSSGGNGLVQQLFTIAGTSFPGCTIQQPPFSQETGLVFRQPLPTFGDGYIDIIENKDIINNLNSNLPLKTSLGIGGVANIADDGSVSRLGWKAQWRAILPAAGAEENVEEGITNEMFLTETDQTPGCDVNPIPEDATNYVYTESSMTPWYFLADGERDAMFVRFLEQPTEGQYCPGGNASSCANGLAEFKSIHCNLCHTVSYTTPPGSIPSQGHIVVSLYSDLLLHHMGSCLADNITQGLALGDMWRTPPLWNLGQRIWFMHDGRTNNLVTAIKEHGDGFQTSGCTGVGSYPSSEADAVIKAFNNLANVAGVDGTAQQDLINFLRSL